LSSIFFEILEDNLLHYNILSPVEQKPQNIVTVFFADFPGFDQKEAFLTFSLQRENDHAACKIYLLFEKN